MSLLLVLFLVFSDIIIAINLPLSTQSEQEEAVQGILFEASILDTLINPSAGGNDRPLVTEFLKPKIIVEEDVKFLLYTNDNPNEPFLLNVNDVNNLNTSTFNGSYPTKVIIHGWNDVGASPWIRDFINDYFKLKEFNIIVVDWTAGSLKEYFVSQRVIYKVGEYLANLLKFLELHGSLSLSDVHILGHSLGAHVAGQAGSGTYGSIGRITALDPARPGFEVPFLKDPKDRLDPTDAKFVDVIHTCAGTLGFVKAIGHADFYPNGGTFRQPGCPVFVIQSCSHERAYRFMKESILNPEAFPAIECSSWTNFRINKCEGNSTTVFMGEHVEIEARNSFFLETNPTSPYGKGNIMATYAPTQ